MYVVNNCNLVLPDIRESKNKKKQRDKLVAVRDKRDSRKKRFIEALTLQGTVYHAAQAAGVSCQTVFLISTFEEAQPWIEVFRSGAAHRVFQRITQQAHITPFNFPNFPVTCEGAVWYGRSNLGV